MKSALFSGLTTAAGIGAAMTAKSMIGKAWPSEPPKNPADRSVSWKSAVQWAIVSSIGAGVARLAARRISAAGWEQATGSKAPGIA